MYYLFLLDSNQFHILLVGNKEKTSCQSCEQKIVSLLHSQTRWNFEKQQDGRG